MPQKCEEPIELTVPTLVTVSSPKLKILHVGCKQDPIMDRQTNRWTIQLLNAPGRPFRPGGIKRCKHHETTRALLYFPLDMMRYNNNKESESDWPEEPLVPYVSPPVCDWWCYWIPVPVVTSAGRDSENHLRNSCPLHHRVPPSAPIKKALYKCIGC